ncbi:DinB family protein [uncultured Polaribacter sp.]|uniref:DinB family protein n=1 Tax=uncultured Polaribacter sp. TaxID=174711 RepID=UPI002632E028|nr:DinB family protein [uncultured Polaribacter sp.]
MIPKNEYAPYFEQYMQLVAQENKSIIENLESSQQEFQSILQNVSIAKQNYAYAADKWTLKQVVQHIIDTERVFTYRALCFARNDKTDLPGFDQDIFVANDNAQNRDFKDLLEEMQTLRKSSIQLFQSFSADVFTRVGKASGNKMSLRALGYLFSGHQKHHLNIIKERYL